MTTRDLRAGLADLAEESHDYADADAALVVARRTHQRRTTMQVAAVAVAVALTAGIAAWAPGAGQTRPAPPATTAPRPYEGYPPSVTLSPDAPVLSPENPIGPAAFIATPCSQDPGSDCRHHVVLPDGREYRLPLTSPPPSGLSLSPDGRYVAQLLDAEGRTRITDLVGGGGRWVGQVSFAENVRPLAWSPDSRYLLLAAHAKGGYGRNELLRYYLMNVRAGEGERIPSGIRRGESAIGVKDDGTLIVQAPTAAGRLPVIRMVDPSSGKELGRIRPSIPAHSSWMIGPDQEVLGGWLHACSCVATFRVYGPGEILTLVDVDLLDGQVTGTWSLPESSTDPADEPGIWKIGGQPAGPLVLVHRHSGNTDVVLRNPVNGEQQVVSRLPHDVGVVPRATFIFVPLAG